jgi:hypothetical protein
MTVSRDRRGVKSGGRILERHGNESSSSSSNANSSAGFIEFALEISLPSQQSGLSSLFSKNLT